MKNINTPLINKKAARRRKKPKALTEVGGGGMSMLTYNIFFSGPLPLVYRMTGCISFLPFGLGATVKPGEEEEDSVT